MSRLSARPGYDPELAGQFMRRCADVHTTEWKANVIRGEEQLAVDIPIIGGTLTLDSSDPVRRHLTLEIGGGEEWAPRDPNSPLVPYGQRINLWVRIDRVDGSWFPWLKMGEYFIQTHSFERPSFITTVECVDISGAVDEYLMMRRRSFVDQTIHEAIKGLCEDAVPGYVFAVESSDVAKDPERALKNYVSEAGMGRWEACTEIAAKRSHECFFNAEGSLIIRHDTTDDDNETIPAVGPDIGTVSNPIATIHDGVNGNLIGMTATLSRQGACNGVRVNLHSTVPKKVRKKRNRDPLPPLPPDATPEEIVERAVEIARREEEGPWRIEWEDAPISAHVQVVQESGPVAWGGLFGRLPIVEERDVKDLKKWSNGGEETWSNEQKDAHRDAKKLLHRRRGVIRFLDLHTLPLYHVEPDDRVRIRWHEREDDDLQLVHEAHYVQRVEFDLAGGPMVIRTRSLNVVDPGAGGGGGGGDESAGGGWTAGGSGSGEPVPPDEPDPPEEPEGPPLPPPEGVYFVGISSSRQGLEGGETHKRQATLDRYNEMATELGVGGAALRAIGGRHVYDTSNTPQNNLSKIAAASHVIADGFGIMMLTSSQWTGVMSGVASGSYDSTITSLWNSKPADMTLIHNVFHEPENNGWSATQQQQWRKVQARMARMAWQLDDPKIWYTDCRIPMYTEEVWNWIPELEALDPAHADEIAARTFLGLDPYPQCKSSGALQTLEDRVRAPLNYWRNRGQSGPICFPEVALFHWKGPEDERGEVVPMTGAAQADRMHDELVTWGQDNGLAAYFYFDVSAPDSPRSQTRALNTPEELLEMGKQIRGDYL